MRFVVPFSIAVGLLWNFLAVRMMGGDLLDALRPTWLIAGATAGLAAGFFTIWSRRRRDGSESFLNVLATFYLGIIVYWMTFVINERILMCIERGGWTDFDLRDHLMMIVIFLGYGTILYGIFLIPLTFLSRYLVWKMYIPPQAQNQLP
jgi:hypothetical protein